MLLADRNYEAGRIYPEGRFQKWVLDNAQADEGVTYEAGFEAQMDAKEGNKSHVCECEHLGLDKSLEYHQCRVA